MEPDTQALEVVCKHLRLECGDGTILNLRRRLNRAHVANHRLRKKAQQLEGNLAVERSCRGVLASIVNRLVAQMDFLQSGARHHIGGA